MKQRWFIVVAVALSPWLVPHGAVAQDSATLQSIIVVFQDDAPFANFRQVYRADEREQLDPQGWSYVERDVAGAVQALETLLNFRAYHVYSAALRGFAARLNASQIAVLRNHPMVAYLEADSIMTTKVQTLPWGIDRVDADQSSTRAGDGTGAVSNVNIYIIDTGLETTHPDLNVVTHLSFTFLGRWFNFDCNGHGTHVAGTAAAIDNTEIVVGVAPGAPLTGIKVLNCFGSGNTSNIIKGVDWVTANAQKPAVANMSLGGSASQALDDAVLNSVASGIFYAVAAGNEGDDACNHSPARVGPSNGVMTVAATDINDQEASWSNYGNCVDIWAPGVEILSTYLGGGTHTLSGTSMASPHVAGAAALFLSANPGATPAQVEEAIKANGLGTGTTSKDGRPITRLHVGNF
jgi:subtilisin family serine protease